MIDSFKIDVPSNELKAHFEKKLVFHRAELERLAEGKIHIVGVRGGTSDLIKMHKVKAGLLDYVVKHMPIDETYRLSLHELDGLEVLKDLVDE